MRIKKSRVVNKGMVSAVVAFILLVVFDLISTLMLKDLVKYLEANVIYKFVGLAGIVGLNLLIILMVYWLYRRSKSSYWRFVWLNLTVTISVMRILIIISNVKVYLNPPTLQAAQQVTQAMKTATMTRWWWASFIPYLIAMVTFYFYQFDHEITVKGQ